MHSNLEEFRLILADRDNPAFMRRTYRLLLGREADAGGLATYVEQLDRGRPPSEVLREFRDGAEGCRARTRGLDEARAMAFLAFEPCAYAVLPILSARVPLHGEEMWSEIGRLADMWAHCPDAEAAAILLGSPIGWLDGYQDGFVTGWALGNVVPTVEIVLNGVLAGQTHCGAFRRDLEEAGFTNACRGFRFKVTNRELALDEMTTVAAFVGGQRLAPEDRIVSPWLKARMDVLAERSFLDFEPLRNAAFQS